MKIKYLKLKNWFLVTLGGLLGLTVSGCYYPCEYGCPEGTYHVKGTVTNSKGDPIEGIGVGRAMDSLEGYVMSEYGIYDTTGPDGRYDVSIYGVPEWPSPIGFCDIDGEQNGNYCDTIIPVSAPASEFYGGDGNWNEGTADINLDVTLTEKTNK